MSLPLTRGVLGFGNEGRQDARTDERREAGFSEREAVRPRKEL